MKPFKSLFQLSIIHTTLIGKSVSLRSKNMEPYPTPNLATILRTLSAYAPAPQPELPPTSHPPQPQVPPPLEDGELPYEPPYEPAELPYEPPAAAYQQPTAPPTSYEPQQPLPQLQPQPPPPQRPQTPIPPQQPTLPSASTITTWPPALRHVTQHLAQNEEVMRRIKHLISTQHNHERQWWSQREALLKTQRGREEGRRRLDGVLYVSPLDPYFPSLPRRGWMIRIIGDRMGHPS